MLLIRIQIRRETLFQISSFHLVMMLIPCCRNSVSVSPSRTELLLLLVIFPAAVPPTGAGHRSSLIGSPVSPPPSLLVPPLRGWLETGVGSAAFLAAVSKREPEKEPQTEAGCGSPPPPVCGCGGGSGSALDGRRQAVVHPPAQQNNRISFSPFVQCCGTVTIFYSSGCGSGYDFWKVMVPVPTFDKLRFRFRFRLPRYLSRP